MSRKRRKHNRPLSIQSPPTKRQILLFGVIAVLFLIALFAVFYFTAPSRSLPPLQTAGQPAKQSLPLKKFLRQYKELSELYKVSQEQLADADIAEINLLCAEDLPGAEKMDIDRCLAKLDEWALKVRFETNRHLYRVKDPRFADHYHHSESYYRAEMLLQVLQEDCGVKYNPERIRDIDFTNSKDLFIHGMIDDTNDGTCASMPVLYVAVGRRLDYPMYLVRAKGHLFARWDNGKDRFNIEGSGEGFMSHPDFYYETWPHPLTEDEKNSGFFLKPLTRQQELSVFFASRGHCLMDTDRFAAAFLAYMAASRYDAGNPIYQRWVAQIRNKLDDPFFKAER